MRQFQPKKNIKTTTIHVDAKTKMLIAIHKRLKKERQEEQERQQQFFRQPNFYNKNWNIKLNIAYNLGSLVFLIGILASQYLPFGNTFQCLIFAALLRRYFHLLPRMNDDPSSLSAPERTLLSEELKMTAEILSNELQMTVRDEKSESLELKLAEEARTSIIHLTNDLIIKIKSQTPLFFDPKKTNFLPNDLMRLIWDYAEIKYLVEDEDDRSANLAAN